MRFFRFSYIVPRVALLAVLLLATEVGSGYLLRWALITGGQATLGAKVEIGKVKSSLLETRVLVREAAVANPRSSMKNLFEADRIEVDFNSSALLRKKLIADYGIISGLEFGTDRQTSGELPESEVPDHVDESPSWVTPIAERYAENWLGDLESRLNTDIHQQFRSVRLAKQLGDRWPQKYKQLEKRALAIKANAKKLEQEVRTARQNPLRHVEYLSQVPSRVQELRTQLGELQSEIAKLPDQVAADRAAVEAARKHDEQLIREQLELGSVDARSISSYLLGEQIIGPVGETIGWIRWARNFVPPRGKVAAEPADRGANVVFAGCEQLPSMLVKAIRLDGSARLGSQQVDLVGVVRDWTNQPELHAKPTTIELTTRGGLPLTIEATFDRTREVARDTMFCSTSNILLPELTLGKKDKLQMAVAPSRADVKLELQLVGDVLTGQVQIAQRGIALSPTLAGGSLGKHLQSALAASVANINQATTTVAVTGTLDEPKFDFESTLGTALASAINNAAADVIAAQRDRLLAKSQEQVDAKLAKLNDEFTTFQKKLNAELQVPGDLIASLLGKGGDDTQIGQSPFGQLFK